MSHTPEPWSYELDHGSFLRIYSETNSNIVYGCGCCGSPNCEDADARRIVACVNRLAPFSTEDIENRAIDLLGGGELVSRVHVYERVIHGLIVALDKIASWNEGEIGGHMDEPVSAGIARKAIAAAKGAET